MSVQYRVVGKHAPTILQQTGTAERVLEVHLVPKLRSILREQGKAVKRAEDFFLEETPVSYTHLTLPNKVATATCPTGTTW